MTAPSGLTKVYTFLFLLALWCFSLDRLYDAPIFAACGLFDVAALFLALWHHGWWRA